MDWIRDDSATDLFLAIQPGSNQIIDAIGAGFMVGMRYGKDSKTSFNLGVGAVVDPNTKILGDGIEANEPLPGNETEIRYKFTDQWGVLVLFSFAWNF